MSDFRTLQKNSRKERDGAKVSVCIMGDVATQFLAQAVKGYGYEFKNYYQIWQQKFDNQTVMNSGADVILFEIGERYSRLVGYVLNDFVQKNYRPKAVISSDDIPEVMENGKTYSFSITIENKGEYNLGYDYMTIIGVLLDSNSYDNIDQKIRFQLPKDTVIRPGEKFTYKITNFTPDYKGKFITFKCGEETVDWISNSIKVNLK